MHDGSRCQGGLAAAATALEQRKPPRVNHVSRVMSAVRALETIRPAELMYKCDTILFISTKLIELLDACCEFGRVDQFLDRCGAAIVIEICNDPGNLLERIHKRPPQPWNKNKCSVFILA